MVRKVMLHMLLQVQPDRQIKTSSTTFSEQAQATLHVSAKSLDKRKGTHCEFEIKLRHDLYIKNIYF